MRCFKIILLGLSLLMALPIMATDYYVDATVSSSGNGLSAANAFKTLDEALDAVDAAATACSITLIGDEEYVVVNNAIENSSELRRIKNDLTIVGSSDMPTLSFDDSNAFTHPVYGSFPAQWSGIVTEADLIIDSVKFSFDGNVAFSNSILNSASTGSIGIHYCSIPVLPTNKYFICAEASGSEVEYCYFEGVTSMSSNMVALVSVFDEPVKVNPFFFLSNMNTAYHIYEGGGSHNIDFGDPNTGDNILITGTSEDIVIPSGTYGDVFVEEDKDFELNGTVESLQIDDVETEISGTFSTAVLDLDGGADLTMSSTGNMIATSLNLNNNMTLTNNGTITATLLDLDDDATLTNNGTMTITSLNLESGSSANLTNNSGATISITSLDLEDGARLTNDGTINTSKVYVEEDAFVDSETSFGSSVAITIDLDFTTGAYRYFTPPFDIDDIDASGLGTIESDVNAAGGSNSVWLFEYDENAKFTSPGVSGWKLITDSNHDLLAGKGYCIWSNASSISVTGTGTYPNVSGGMISDNIEYSASASGDANSGFNYLGNMYSLPMDLPTDISGKVTAYYYYNGSGYVSMSGDGIVSGAHAQSSIVVPSYGAFFIQASKDESNFGSSDFGLDNLLNTSSVVRLKSASVSEEPKYLRVKLQKEDDYDDAIIRFEEDAAFDNDAFDVNKVYPLVLNKALISTSSVAESGDFVIQALPSLEATEYNTTQVVPLNFNAPSSGDYYLSVGYNNITETDLLLKLYDTQSEIIHDLNGEDSVTIHLEKGDSNSRYVLRVSGDGVVTNDADVYTSDKIFEILINEGTVEVQSTDGVAPIQMVAYDLLGKQMFQKNINGGSGIVNGFESGVYIIKLSQGDKIETHKIIVR